MKILLVSNSYPIKESGGVAEHVRLLAMEMAKKHKVMVFTREWDYNEAEYKLHHYQDQAVKVASVVNNSVFPPDFSKSYTNEHIDAVFRLFLKRFRPNIIHFHHLHTLSINLPAIAKELGIPYVFTLHDFWYMCPCVRLQTLAGKVCQGTNFQCVLDYYKLYPPLSSEMFSHMPKSVKKMVPDTLKRQIKSWLVTMTPPSKNAQITRFAKKLIAMRAQTMKAVLGSAKTLVAPSAYVKAQYVRFGIPRTKIKVIPHGIDTSHLTGLAKTSSVKLRFAYLGTIYDFKGVDLVIKALQAQTQNNAWQLTIFGDYTLNPIYFKTLKKIIMSPNITFFGKYVNKKLPQILRDIDVVVVPSKVPESFNLVIREALASGTPVVAANIGALPEVVKNKINGLTFKSGNLKDLTAKITSLMSHPEVVQVYRRGAAKTNITDITTSVGALEKLYTVW